MCMKPWCVCLQKDTPMQRVNEVCILCLLDVFDIAALLYALTCHVTWSLPQSDMGSFLILHFPFPSLFENRMQFPFPFLNFIETSFPFLLPQKNCIPIPIPFLTFPFSFLHSFHWTNLWMISILSRATKGNSNPRLKGNRKGIIVKGKEFYIPILNTFPTR